MAKTREQAHTEFMIREVAKSTYCKFGTFAPFAIGAFTLRRIGFADIPVACLEVTCKPENTRDLTPVVRSIVYKELELHGVESEILEFTPTVNSGVNRQTLFVDENKDSPTCGKRKRGRKMEWHFEIKKIHVAHFDWEGRRGKFRDTK